MQIPTTLVCLILSGAAALLRAQDPTDAAADHRLVLEYAAFDPLLAVPATLLRFNLNCAGGAEYGTSCGPLRALHFGTPRRGGTAWFDVYDALPGGAVVLGIGLTPNAPSAINLTSYGYTNCRAFHDYPYAFFMAADAAGAAYHGIALPNTSYFDVLRIHGQWFGIDPAQPGGLTVSNYIVNTVGIDP